MKITTNITKKDLIIFNLSILPKLKSTYVSMVILSMLIFFFLIWSKGFPVSQNNWFAIIVGSIGGGISGTIIGILFNFSSILFMSTSKNGILGIHEYQITNVGLHEKTSANEGVSKWEGIEKIELLKSYALFKISGYLYHIIPKRSFESSEKFNDFYNYSRKQWENSHNKALNRTDQP